MVESVSKAVQLLCKGLRDCFQGMITISTLNQSESEKHTPQHQPQGSGSLARRRGEKKQPKQEAESPILKRIALCCGFNGGIFWLSIIVFNHVLLPWLQFMTQFFFNGSDSHGLIWSWLGPILSWTFSALWILPLFALSKVINNIWFQDVANTAFKKSRSQHRPMPGLGKMFADLVFSLLLQSIFLLQGMITSFLPIGVLGGIVFHIHMCLLYSLYAFEYKWMPEGIEVSRRLSLIEDNWPYFLGFSLPLGILTSLPDSYIVGGCVFSILFPLFIISAHASTLDAAEKFDVPLRLFSPATWLCNAIFNQSMKVTAAVSARQAQAGAQSQEASTSR